MNFLSSECNCLCKRLPVKICITIEKNTDHNCLSFSSLSLLHASGTVLAAAYSFFDTYVFIIIQEVLYQDKHTLILIIF